MENNKLEEWQNERMKFYTESSALPFIDNYFDIKKENSVRCIVGHVKDMYKQKKMPTYRIYENNKCRAMTIPDIVTNKYNALKDFWCIHSYMYTFDKNILNLNELSNKREIFKVSISGLNGVLEIDSPDEPYNDVATRTNFFDHVPEFNDIIHRIDKKLDSLGEDYNLMFSGNGVYVILEGYYEENLGDYVSNFVNLLDTLKEEENMENKLNVHLDNKSAPWNDYFKIPFTFHEKRQRISIPLSKDEINKDWIDHVTNTNNVMNDYKIIDEIISKARWQKLW